MTDQIQMPLQCLSIILFVSGWNKWMKYHKIASVELTKWHLRHEKCKKKNPQRLRPSDHQVPLCQIRICCFFFCSCSVTLPKAEIQKHSLSCCSDIFNCYLVCKGFFFFGSAEFSPRSRKQIGQMWTAECLCFLKTPKWLFLSLGPLMTI